MPTVENKGNLVMRRACALDDERETRIRILRKIVNKAMSTTYQMVEEIGDYGSGSPSPLHMVCETIREFEQLDRREGREISTAEELARYPLDFLSELRGEGREVGQDAGAKIAYLLREVSDLNFRLRGRALDELSPGELREFGQKSMNIEQAARELGAMFDAQHRETVSSYPGAPIQGERPRSRATVDG